MSQQSNKQKQQECLQQLKQYLLFFESNRLHELLQNVELNEQISELSLINVFQILRDYLENQTCRQNIAEFIVQNCEKIISYVFFQRNASFQDYYLLYDVIYLAIRLLPQHEDCIMSIEKTFPKIDPSFQNQLIQNFLSTICMLLRIKLQGNKAFCQRDQFKSFCLNPNVNNVVIDFALKLIKDKHIGQANHFSFFKMRIGERAYNSWLEEASKTKSSAIKDNKQTKKRQAISQQSTGVKDRQNKKIEVLNENITIKGDLSAWIGYLKSYKGNNYQQDPQVEKVLQKILSSKTQQILKMNQYKELTIDLLKLSFSFSELISFSISIGVFVMDVEDFINVMISMLRTGSISQNQAESLKKSVRKALQECCGSQSAYLWKRITSSI